MPPHLGTGSAGYTGPTLLRNSVAIWHLEISLIFAMEVFTPPYTEMGPLATIH